MCHIDNLLKNCFEAATLKKTNMVEEAAVSGAAIIAHHVAKGTLMFSSTLLIFLCLDVFARSRAL